MVVRRRSTTTPTTFREERNERVSSPKCIFYYPCREMIFFLCLRVRLVFSFFFPTRCSPSIRTLNLVEKTRTATETETFQNLARTKISRERDHTISLVLSLSYSRTHKSFARRERRGRNLSLLFSLYYSLSIAKVFSLVREREREFKKNLCVTPLCAFPEEEEDNDQIVA